MNARAVQPPPRASLIKKNCTGPHSWGKLLRKTSTIPGSVPVIGMAWLWMTTPMRMALTLSRTLSSEAAFRVNFRIWPKLSSSMTVSAPSALSSGVGRAFLLTFPFARRGISSRPWKRWGTMYATNRSLQKSRRSAGTAGTTYATNLSSKTVTMAAFTAGCAPTAASTSPISILAPRTLTMESRRPTIFKFPSTVHLPRSPERAAR
mmetsp:Transcript_84313/g.236158  ORF Transcript_84313/g.236158 Transcript_84313/m.236158 type:complete len:206 (-) Transcript_84313:23-640(-)